MNHVALFLKPVLFCFSFTPVDADEILSRNDLKDKFITVSHSLNKIQRNWWLERCAMNTKRVSGRN